MTSKPLGAWTSSQTRLPTSLPTFDPDERSDEYALECINERSDEYALESTDMSSDEVAHEPTDVCSRQHSGR